MSEQVITSGIRPATSRTAPAEAHVNIPFKEALLVALAAGLGYGFDAYAVNIFGMLGPTLAHDLDVSIKTIGLIGSIFLVGYTIGTIGFGYLADRIGRRDTLGYSIILYGITTALGGISLKSLYLYLPSLLDWDRRRWRIGSRRALHCGDVSEEIPRARYRRYYVFAVFGGVHFRCNMYNVHRPALRLAMGIWLCDHPRYPGFRAPPYRSGVIPFQTRTGRNREAG